jgi:uncharacterized membrane protein YdjX (TVP38/TMEM64 family)
MPWYQFLFWCFLGKLPKMLLVAYAGSAGIDWIKDLFTLGQSP